MRMTSEELEQYERDHQQLDLDSHQPRHEENTIMKFRVCFDVLVDDDTAREMAEEQGIVEDFEDDPVGVTAENIAQDIDDNDYAWSLMQSPKVSTF